MSKHLEIRRAKRSDLAAITSLVQEAADSNMRIDEAEVMEWLLSKGLWVALQDDTMAGVAAWQVENLVSVTDVFYISPAQLLPDVGSRLLETIEAEACTLMCETNIVLLPAWASESVHSFLRQQGYESKRLEELHRIHREVLSDFIHDGPDLMVKRLRDQMVMAPL